MMRKTLCILALIVGFTASAAAQINTDKVLAVGRNALYFEDYILSIQYFNQVITARPNFAEPYLYRAYAKLNLDDFSGAERDLTACLKINPFLVRAYLLRGIAYQYLGNYQKAIDDYNRGLEDWPEDKQLLINKAIAFVQDKKYDDAIATMNTLVGYQPKYVQAYITRGAIYAENGDTVSALKDYNHSLELDKFNASAYAQRALLYYQQENYKAALSDLDEAVRLEPKQKGYYINRGLVRYNLNDLRGAMSDYDAVMILDKNNTIAHYNRGLLRAQIGDVDNAIADFNAVINNEPDNFMAIYNRALLNEEAHRYKEAIADINTVLEEYPYFISGFYLRAEIKRKSGDVKGGDRDYWYAFDLEQKLKKEKQAGKVVTAKGVFDKEPDTEEISENDDAKTRERSDKNIEKFNRLMVYDKDEESATSLTNDLSGRVQDRNVKVELRQQFVITYYEKTDEIDRSAARYDKTISDYNSRGKLKMQLKVTNEEAALSDRQIATHFASIDEYSYTLELDSTNLDARFGRSMDFMVVQNLSEAVSDLNKLISLYPDFILARFNRAVINYKILEIERFNQSSNVDGNELSFNIQTGMKKRFGQSQTVVTKNIETDNQKTNNNYLYEEIISDYTKIIDQSPDFVFARFNRANIYCSLKDYRSAIADYNAAITKNQDFAEAWFNRGLTRLYIGDTELGIEDLSRAGELGIPEAYGIIKKMTAN